MIVYFAYFAMTDLYNATVLALTLQPCKVTTDIWPRFEDWDYQLII